jgi:hypothetical protein
LVEGLRWVPDTKTNWPEKETERERGMDGEK